MLRNNSYKVIIKSQISDSSTNSSVKTIGQIVENEDSLTLLYCEEAAEVTIHIYNNGTIGFKRVGQANSPVQEMNLNFILDQWTEGSILTSYNFLINVKCYTRYLKIVNNTLEIKYCLDYDEKNEHCFNLEYISKKGKV